MTRRAKERRAERVQEKQRAMEERLRREAQLSSRPAWRALLLRIDGGDEIAQSVVSPRHRQTESEALLSAPPVSTAPDTVQWKSTNVPVAAATIFQLPITVEAPEATLQFEFSTRDYDINFGIQLLGADGKLVVVMSTERYESHVKQVAGSVEIQGPVLALLIWDNSYSWLNVKQLAYSVELKQRFPDSGLDAAAVVTPAQRAALAVHERAKREKLRVHQEATLSKIHATINGQDDQIESIKKQIEELQRTLEATEAAKEATIKEEGQVNEEIASLTWEIDALLWRSMGASVIQHIFSFCDDETLRSWSITSRQWHQRIALAQETGETAAKESPSP